MIKKDRSFFNSRLFIQNLIYIGGMLLLFFIAFAVIMYKRSENILTGEFSASAENQLQLTANAIDEVVSDARYIVAGLSHNNIVSAFFALEEPEVLYDEFESRLKETLQTYTTSHSAIDSIYLYAESFDKIITNRSSISSFYGFKDDSWTEMLTDDTASNGVLLFPRAKEGFYPYLITFLKQYEISGRKAVIVLNLNPSKISHLKNVSANPYQSVYLISDENQILYRRYQQDLLEPFSLIPELAYFQETSQLTSSVISTESGSAIFTQVHAQNAPWYYVTVTNLEIYSQKLSSNTVFLVIFLAALFVTILILSFLFSIRSTKPIYSLLHLLKEPDNENLLKHMDKNEIQYISEQIVGYAQKNQELSDELSKRLNLLNDAKMLALQSQINPHFLFNTINMIYLYECAELGYAHKIPKLTLKLSRLLKYAFQSTDLVTMGTELEFVKSYLTLMQERYDNKFQVVYDIAPETLTVEVPKLFIQPIIENSIFHGLAKCTAPDASLCVRTCIQDERCMVEISDNGCGMDTEKLARLRNIVNEEIPQSTSVGLRNVIVRMKLLYGEQFSFYIESEPGKGSVFTMLLPPPGKN